MTGWKQRWRERERRERVAAPAPEAGRPWRAAAAAAS
jgi:hypothetical protein